jgi:serine kinase of HPr protein (carbohydrate metabolism regulator)
MGNAKKNDAWITIMRHLNVVAVASLAGVSVILFAKNITPDEAVIKKAEMEEICLIQSPLSSFEISGKLYQLLY